MKQRILITGGHSSPAIALIEMLLRNNNAPEIHVVTRKYSFSEAKAQESFEYGEFSSIKNIHVHVLETVRLPKSFRISSLCMPIKLFSSIMKSLRLLKTIKPDVVVYFGGYVGAPIVVASIILKIPFIIHDQTIKAGRANILFSRFAKKVFISWKESINDFPRNIKNNCVLIGNPIRQSIQNLINTTSYRKQQKVSQLYITGGSTGSHAINEIVAEIIPRLVTSYYVIHQCGSSQHHDYEKLTSIANNLPKQYKDRYKVYTYIQRDKLEEILRTTSIIIGRSGANTMIETALLGIPAIFIPLPISQYNEQEQLAQKLARYKSVEVIRQEKLNSEYLLSIIYNVVSNYDEYIKYAKQCQTANEIKIHSSAAFFLAHYLTNSINTSIS